MRAVHVAPFYHPVIGGVEEVVKRIAEYTASRGYEVYVVTYNRARVGGVGSLPREETINGVCVIRLKSDFMWSHGTYSSELPETLRKLEPDVVHVHVWRHPHVFQVARLKRKLNFKAILHSHAPFHRLNQLGVVTWLYHRVVDMLMKKVLREYDQVIALTPHEKSVLEKKLGVNEDKITVIPNGIDDELAALAYSVSTSMSDNIVLYLGRISYSKNVDLLVRAMVYVKRDVPGSKLVLAGPDEEIIAKLKRYADKRGIDLRYLGVVSEDEKRKLYSECKVFAHPALYEPFGITLLEAQAFGKPCVITGEGGQLYVAPPGKVGVYAEPNPRSYAKAISILLMDRHLYMKLSINAKAWASQYIWSKILPKYERLYGELIYSEQNMCTYCQHRRS